VSIIDKILRAGEGRMLRKLDRLASQVDALQEDFEALTDEELQAKTQEFKDRLEEGETLDDILVEAFATVREASWRILRMRPFHVQVMGGIALHQGKIAEMKTGEGKTLVATCPVFLRALSGRGVHVVTVNGEEVPMPLKEFELLEILLRNVGRVMTRGQLIERVWGADYVGDTKTLDVHIKRLRSKIEPDSSAPRYVVTVRGLGYKFEN